MANAGKLVIDVSAGTAQFVLDMERVNGKLRDFGRSADEAGAHVVTSMQATSGAIRTLEGNSIRAAERFLSDTLGVGKAMQAIFPIVGALATVEVIAHMGSEIGKLTGWWGGVSEAEKKATEEAQRLDEKIQSIGQHIQQLDLESFGIKFGSLAQKGQQLAQMQKTADDLRRQIQVIEGDQFHAALPAADDMASDEAAAYGVGIYADSAQKKDAASRADALKRLHAQLEQAEKEIRNTAEQLGQKELDDTQSKNNALIEEQNRLIAARAKGAEALKRIDEIITRSRQEMSRQQESDAQRGAEWEARQFEKSLQRENESLEAQQRAAEKETALYAERARAAQILASGFARVDETNAKGSGEQADLALERQKLELERQYGEAITHSLSDRIAYLTRVAQLERQAADAKIAGLEAERAIAQAQSIAAAGREAGEQLIGKGGTEEAEEAARAMEKVAELTQQIATLRQQADNSQFASMTNVKQLQAQRQLGLALGAGDALAGGFTNGIFGGGGKGQDIGTQITKSLENFGKQLGGEMLKKLIEQLVVEVVALTGNTAAITANTAAQAAGSAGGILGGLGKFVMALGFAANGGNISGWTLVGEKGPELIHGTGTVVPNSVLSAAPRGGGQRGAASGTGISFGDMHFHAYGVDSPQEHAEMMTREIPNVLKALSPKFAAFAS
jgi:hypothetical protein